jgi:hypothetical protein
MTGILSSIVNSVISAVVGAGAGSAITYLLSRRQRKVDRTPIIRFDFSDTGVHENLGAVGFRNIESKLELLISGTICNVGSVLARDVRLDIYHFQGSRAPATHEIANIHVADALQPGEAVPWSKSIRLSDLTVTDRYYKSGSTGIFRVDPNSRYYHHHVVFSCKNVQGEQSSTIYCTEKIIKNNSFGGNRMMFVRYAGAYRPETQFPVEWKNEIKTRERSLKGVMKTSLRHLPESLHNQAE